MNAVEPALLRLNTARSLLLEPYGLDETHLQRALASVFEHRADYADLYFQYTRSESYALEEGIVKSGSFGIDQGVGVRAISGERTAFSYSDDISNEALIEAARTVRSIARGGSGKTVVAPSLNTRPQKALYGTADPVASLPATQKVQLLESVEQAARALDPRVKQVMANLASEYDVVLVARSDGVLAADVRPLVRLSVTVIAEENGRREQGFSGGGGRAGLEIFTTELLQEYARQAVDMALVNLQARPAPAGIMSVVLGPGWPGILLHEAIGHGLEGDFNRKGSSAFAGPHRPARCRQGRDRDRRRHDRRAARLAQHRRRRQCYAAHGADRGRHLARLHAGLLNARLMKTGTTGNARRESFAALPMPRMTNTCMLGGTPIRRRSCARSRAASMRAILAAARSTSPTASSSSRWRRPI
jgi:TldD protein